MSHDVDFFLIKFERIPEGLWCTNTYTNKFGHHCAIGHCDFTTPESTMLRELVFVSLGVGVANINDGEDPRYQQPTPKQRILAALRDIKSKQSPPVEQPTKQEPKVIYKTVVIDTPVKELTEKELSQQ